MRREVRAAARTLSELFQAAKTKRYSHARIRRAVLSAFLGVAGIWLSWPVGWITAAVLSVIFYQKGVWRNRAVTEEEGHEL